MKHLIKILALVLSLTLMAGCASDFVSTDSGSSSASDDSADRSFHETIDQVNQQTALDAANAAAQQQFNDAMAATQQTMNNATNGQPLHDP
jgi:ABC-type oligopeptide transport system substrate-binding subunit